MILVSILKIEHWPVLSGSGGLSLDERINIQKIGSLRDLFNSPINEVFFEVKSDMQIEEISKILKDEGKTIVNINLITEDNNLKFRLKNTRKLDRKSLNLLRNQEIQAIIN